MNNTNVRTAPDIAQGLVKELNGAQDAPSLQKAIQDTYDANDKATQTDWNAMSAILRNSVSLKRFGLGDFVLTGVDESSKGVPELTMVRNDGSVNIALVAGSSPDAPSPTVVSTQTAGDGTATPGAPASRNRI
jgi:hypothetical protein